ncbi:T9SS type A sorting domain-containing protein [Flavobacterium resistens]|uniref:T9SS type A sorting domain-containing protein n=1 Tax=Flavobacterium resistens TaxID=443612 RepID=A0ABW9Q964_9FLAO|nr:leucine-rich repeat domain-containing protein [Flavobacterium resistens]MRX69561.1 T9SS type A sorting domain-containing protein [Flavobacterium resistens]
MKTKLLLLLFLANFSIYAQTNLVPNGNFEIWTSSSQPDNWYRYFSGFVSQNSVAQNGSSSTNMMVASGTFNYINSEYFPVVAGKTYRVTLYHKLAKGTFSSIDFSLYHKPGTFKEEIIKKSDVTFSTSEWRKIEFDYTPTVSENVEVDIWTTGSLNSEILVDNISMVDVNEVPVQYTLIPDVNFEKKLIALGIDSGATDGKVLTSKVATLTTLSISNSSITDLTGIQDFKALTYLDVTNNKLGSIDVSKNTALKQLRTSWNPIKTLDVSKNVLLYELGCYSNDLTVLDLSANINLTNLQCSQNALTTLDVSKNPELTKLEANNNSNLSQVNLKNGKNTLIKASDLILTSNPSLTCIIVDDVTYSNTNWATSKESSADFSTTECAAPAYTLIPDINFERTLIKKGIDAVEDGKVLTKRIASITILNLSDYYTNLKIEDLTGLQDFAALEELTLPNNGNGILTSIDVSKNLKLKKLNCNSNKLASLDVSKNLALTDLNVYYNNLTTLDVSKNLELKTLTCSLNRLTTLDVSKNLALKELYAEGSNKEGSYSSQQGLLTTIDLSKNLELERLSLASNEKIVNLDVSKNIKLKHISVNGNGLTTVDFSANPLLESLYCSTNKLTSLDLSKYPALTTLDCSYNQIKTIDVSQKTNLKFLNVWSNELTSLDVSKNTALERIYCPYNKLTTLDLSNNPNLLQVLCTGNNLMKLNLKNGGNTKMTNQSSSLFGGNPNLTCILVDDVAYSNANWSSFKDQFANYNTECEFSLGPKNFAIESKGETCTGENNGQITVTATAQLPYTATVNGTSKTFVNNSLQITNLAPGTYTVIIAVTGETYEQTFNIVIPKAATIAGKSTIASKKVEVEITEGTAPFTVFVNGEAQFQTTDSNFSLELDQAGLVEVATSKACEGIFAKKVSSSELGTMLSAYPNPTSDNVEIEIPNSKSETVIEIFNFGGQVVSKGTYNTENGTAYLNLANLPSGIYAAKIYLETPEYVKIIKK